MRRTTSRSFPTRSGWPWAYRVSAARRLQPSGGRGRSVKSTSSAATAGTVPTARDRVWSAPRNGRSGAERRVGPSYPRSSTSQKTTARAKGAANESNRIAPAICAQRGHSEDRPPDRATRHRPWARPAGLYGLASKPEPGGDHITGGVSSPEMSWSRTSGSRRRGFRRRIPARPTVPVSTSPGRDGSPAVVSDARIGPSPPPAAPPAVPFGDNQRGPPWPTESSSRSKASVRISTGP